MVPPLVLDIDGTLTRPNVDVAPPPIDPRCFDPLRSWEAPVILATGKAFPAPVTLCQSIGIPVRVVAETGGVVHTNDHIETRVDPERLTSVAAALTDAGLLSTDEGDLINRWRESEIAVRRTAPIDTVRRIAADHDLVVVDSGYAYHVKAPDVSKGTGLASLLDWEDLDAEDCVAIGDSANDVSVFDRVGRSFAVANAAPAAREAADEVLESAHADGTLSVLDRLR